MCSFQMRIKLISRDGMRDETGVFGKTDEIKEFLKQFAKPVSVTPASLTTTGFDLDTICCPLIDHVIFSSELFFHLSKTLFMANE